MRKVSTVKVWKNILEVSRQVAIKFWVAVIGGEVKIRYFPGKVPLLTDPLNLMMRFVLDIWTQKIDCLVHKKQIQIK